MADTETNEIIQNLRKALARIRHLANNAKHGESRKSYDEAHQEGNAIADIYEIAHTALRIRVGTEPMRCAECDCAKGGADCNWVARPRASVGQQETADE